MTLVLNRGIRSHDPGRQGAVLQHALNISGFGCLGRIEFEGHLSHNLRAHHLLGPVNRAEIAVSQTDQQTVFAVSHRLSAQFRNIHNPFLLPGIFFLLMRITFLILKILLFLLRITFLLIRIPFFS